MPTPRPFTNVNFFFVYAARRVAKDARDGRIQVLTGDKNMKLVTVAEMRAIEKEADAGGLSVDKMMENAGDGLADEIQMLPYGGDEAEREGLGLVGSGNNGGETPVGVAPPAGAGRRTPGH